MKKKDDQLTTQSQIEEWKNKYLRALADYQNLEKRTINQREETQKFAVQIFLEKLLPIVDVLDQARRHLKDQGLDLALKELHELLSRTGVEKISTVGQKFSPFEMECVETLEGEEDKVIEEVIPGYKLHQKILRVAKVKVGKQKLDEKAQNLVKE